MYMSPLYSILYIIKYSLQLGTADSWLCVTVILLQMHYGYLFWAWPSNYWMSHVQPTSHHTPWAACEIHIQQSVVTSNRLSHHKFAGWLIMKTRRGKYTGEKKNTEFGDFSKGFKLPGWQFVWQTKSPQTIHLSAAKHFFYYLGNNLGLWVCLSLPSVFSMQYISLFTPPYTGMTLFSSFPSWGLTMFILSY